MPLRQLYPDPEKTAEDEAIVDIVAVHGLNPRSKPDQEHAWDTWRTPAGPEGKLWLRDELPKELPHARIFLYEYNSTAVYGKDRTTFIDKVNAFLEAMRIDRRKAPRRPLLLLGHSLGGLLIKQALINAHNNDKYQDIKLATQGLAFFATPHDGGRQSLVNIGQIAAKIALSLGFQKGDNILETLKEGSMFSDLMHEHWKQRLLEYPIVSFWGTLDNIVPRESTSFGLPGKHENVVSLQASHGGVCKFGTSVQDRDNFKLVQANIQDLYDSAIATGQYQLEQDPNMKKKAERAKRVEKLLRGLYKSSYRDAKDRNPPRVQGTCEWFTSHDRFQDWKDGKTCGLLWVSADPGCGKSVLSRHLVDDVLQGSSSSTTCYFFFKDDFEDQKSAVGALCCLLRQLFKGKPALLQDSILKQFGEDGDRLLDSFRDLWHILVSVSRDHESGQIVCILDALDECEERDRHLLIETLNDFYLEKGTNTKLKFLVTSRPYLNIERGFHDVQTKLPMIHLRGEGQSESEKIAREIDLVVEARITKLCDKLQLTEQKEKVMRREMTQHSNRTYLWVHLVFELLEGCAGHSSTQIEGYIRNIPPTVDDAYEKILSRSSDKDQARKLLHVVVAAKRPLTLKEMAAAMNIKRSHTLYSELEIETEEEIRTWVRQLCGLFVSIIGGKIYLLHQTAAEFLVERVGDRDARGALSKEDNYRFEWKCSLPPGLSNLILGSVCAQLLLLTDVVDYVEENSYRVGPRSLYFLDRKYPLLGYSVEHWATHLGDASSEKDLPWSNMLQLCSGSESACLVAWPGEDGNSRSYESYKHAKALSPLVVASILGLEAVARYLLKLESTDANEGDPIFKLPPLSWAVRSGHKAVFDVFIEAETHYQKRGRLLKRLFRMCCVDFNVRNESLKMGPKAVRCAELKDPTTPLGWAVCFGEAYMVERLLATRRVAVAKEMLFEAAMNDREDILRALLATGQVRVRCQTENGRRLLNWALKHSAFNVTKYLMDTRKFDIGTEMQPWPGEFSGVAYAAQRGANELLQLLLATGKADIDFRNNDSQERTPLSFSAEAGAQGCVRLLLATGQVEIDNKGDPDTGSLPSFQPLSANPLNDVGGDTPLLYAAKNGHEGVVRLLLATGNAMVNCQDVRRRTPLSHAAERGHEGVVRELLKTGKAIVDNPDTKERTPLSYAAERGHEGIVRELLATGRVTADFRDSLKRTPLSYAAEWGHEEIAQHLVATGKANIDLMDDTGKTPLSHAAEKGREGVVQQLLATGEADVNSMDNLGQTPLHHAVQNYNEGVVQQLLAMKPDVNVKDKDGQTALFIAVSKNWETCVNQLLAVSNIDVNMKNSEGKTLLALAAWYGWKEVVRKLLATDKVDVNERDCDGLTALEYAVRNFGYGAIDALFETRRVIITPKCWSIIDGWVGDYYIDQDDVIWMTEKLKSYKPG